jgi:hypothetical protein
MTAQNCIRCGSGVGESENISSNRPFLKSALLRRAVVCMLVILGTVAAFYASLVLSASPLDREQRRTVEKAIAHLERSGFTKEVFLPQAGGGISRERQLAQRIG